jgi:hypothetical protein
MNAPRRRSLPSSLGWASAVALLVLSTGCSRAHLTPTHGRAYHEIFAAQDANPQHKNQKSVHGLDSQEAAIISSSYRKALSPAAAPTAQSQQLLTTSTTGGGAAAPVPATSVPGGS